MWMKAKYKSNRIKKIIIINLLIICVNAISKGEDSGNKNFDIKNEEQLIEKNIQGKQEKLEVKVGNKKGDKLQEVKQEQSNVELYLKYSSKIKDSIEIVYYIVFSVIALMTYLSAKKTIFLPLKSEVYKYQIEELEKLYRYLVTNDLISGLEANCYMNTAKIIEDYIATKKWGNHLIDNVEFNKKIGSVTILDKYKEDEIMFLKSEEKKKKNEITDWQEYKIKRIIISKKFEIEEKKIESFISSPFLPKTLLLKIEELDAEIKNINYGLKEYLTELLKEIPLKVKKDDDMKENLDILYSILLEEVNLEDKVSMKRIEIQKIIRRHLNSDFIFIK